MTLPLLGVAILRHDVEPLRDWVFAEGRAVEIQDFITADVLAEDPQDLALSYRRALDGHAGPRLLHGPFFGLDLSAPDEEIRAVVQKRLLQGLGMAEKLGCGVMVVHSPFNYWHVLNRRNYAGLYEWQLECMEACLAPVLERAADQGCVLALENIDETDPEDRVRLVARLDHPALRVSLDTGHAELAHGRYNAPPVVDFVTAAGKWLAHVHLQDCDGYADRHWHPGDGIIPWQPVFAALAALPQAPHLILEVRGDKERLPETVARLEARGLAR